MFHVCFKKLSYIDLQQCDSNFERLTPNRREWPVVVLSGFKISNAKHTGMITKIEG